MTDKIASLALFQISDGSRNIKAENIPTGGDWKATSTENWRAPLQNETATK